VINTAMAALDRIHNIPLNLARPFWKAKLVSLSLSVAAILLLINASFLVFISDLIVEMVAKESGNLKFGLLAIWQRVTWPIALAIVALAFALIYRFGPSHRDKQIPILPGAILGAVCWAILSSLFRQYVLHFGNYNRTYGTVGAVIVLMFWLYLSSLVMLVGAQLNVTVGEAMKRR
jgi:membrane protein